MKYVLSLLVILASYTSIAQEMVFLVEGAQGKHVGFSKDFKTFEYLTTGSDWHLYPDISANGEWITYVHGKDQDHLSVVVENRRNGIKEKWGTEGFVLQPKFSDNAKVIYFTKMINGKNQIAKINLAEARKVIRPRLQNGYLMYTVSDEVLKVLGTSFFPVPFENGEKIIYQRNQNSKREIVLYNFVEKKETVISEGMSPTLSKDEQFVAFTKKVNGNWDIYIYNLITKTEMQLTTDGHNDFSPVFDLENNVLYTSDKLENGVYSIFKQKYSNWSNGKFAEKVVITEKGTSFYAPRISGITKYKQIKMPDMTGIARSSFGSIYHKGRLYVVGGHQGAEHTYPPESFTGRMTYYDFKDGKWHNAAPRLTPCHGFQVAAYGDYLYAFGGFAYEETTSPKWKSLDVVERYNIKTNTWEEVATMPRRRSSNIVNRIGTKVYIMGGWDSTPKFQDDIDGTFHSEIDVYDIETNTFTTLNAKLTKKRRAFSGFVKDEKIYFVGGISEGGSHFSLLSEFVEFDPKTEKFTKLADLPFGTFAPAAGQLNNKAFVFGGMFKLGEWNYEYVRHIYEYDFALNKWQHSGRYLNESKGFSQVVEYDGLLGILGGHTYEGNLDKPVATFETFE